MWRFASVFWLLVGLGVNDAYWLLGPQWNITTKTGDKEHADTNAGVYIILTDAYGQKSAPTKLDTIMVNDFERGDTNTFFFQHLRYFKDVCYIRIFHDNSGDDPSWYLDWVEVKSKQIGIPRKFIINGWVPTEQEEREKNFVIENSYPCSAGHLP